MSCPVHGLCGAGCADSYANAGWTGRVKAAPSCSEHRHGERARIVDFVLYDDLDPYSLDSGIIRFDGRYFGDLWALCKARSLTVVADIHVHPGGAGQSESDRAHPMISSAGHTALVLPRFAVEPLPPREIGIYQYKGGKRWTTVPAAERRSFFHIGL